MNDQRHQLKGAEGHLRHIHLALTDHLARCRCCLVAILKRPGRERICACNVRRKNRFGEENERNTQDSCLEYEAL